MGKNFFKKAEDVDLSKNEKTDAGELKISGRGREPEPDTDVISTMGKKKNGPLNIESEIPEFRPEPEPEPKAVPDFSAVTAEPEYVFQEEPYSEPEYAFDEWEQVTYSADGSLSMFDADPYQNQYSAKKKKSNTGLIIALVAIIAVIVVMAGAFLYLYMQDRSGYESDQERADEVIERIINIGTPSSVTLNDENLIKDAREAYDDLTDQQKTKVTNYNSLIEAESAYEKAEMAEQERIKEEERAAQEQAAIEQAAREASERTAREAAEREAAEKQRQQEQIYNYLYGYSGSNSSSSGGTSMNVRTKGDNLNLRDGPGESYNVITKIPNGSRITVYSQSGSWYYVSYNGYEGWVRSDYVG